MYRLHNSQSFVISEVSSTVKRRFCAISTSILNMKNTLYNTTLLHIAKMSSESLFEGCKQEGLGMRPRKYVKQTFCYLPVASIGKGKQEPSQPLEQESTVPPADLWLTSCIRLDLCWRNWQLLQATFVWTSSYRSWTLAELKWTDTQAIHCEPIYTLDCLLQLYMFTLIKH